MVVQVRQVQFLVLQSTRCRQRDLRRRHGQLLQACHQPACLLVVLVPLVLDPFRLLLAQCLQLVDLFRLLQVAVVQFRRLLLVAQVVRPALVVHQWVAVLAVLVLVLALDVFLQVHLVAVQ